MDQTKVLVMFVPPNRSKAKTRKYTESPFSRVTFCFGFLSIIMVEETMAARFGKEKSMFLSCNMSFNQGVSVL